MQLISTALAALVMTCCTSMLDDLRPGPDAGPTSPPLELTTESSDSVDDSSIVDETLDPQLTVPAASQTGGASQGSESDAASVAPTTEAPTSTVDQTDGGNDYTEPAATDAGDDSTSSADTDTGTETVLPVDEPAPELLQAYPPSGGSDVSVDAHLVLEFSVDVRPGTGDLVLSETEESNVVERLAVTDARVTFVAQRVTVDWESPLAFGTAYTVSIDEGAILADSTTAPAWPADVSFEFTTVAPPALELLATSPVTGTTDVDPNTNVLLTFSEPIVMGAGGLELRQGGVLTERFDADSPNLVVSGPSVTLDPSQALDNAKSYSITVEPAAVISERGAVFAGFDSSSTFTFTTAAAPPPPLVLNSTVPQNGEANVAIDTSVSLVFAEPIRAGLGALTIVDADTGLPFESAMATDARVSVSANTATFTPQTALDPATDYYVTVDAGSFESFAGASFAGFTAPTTLRFTTRGTPASCGAGESEAPNGGCYYLHDTGGTFDAAIALCAARGANWHLAEPRSAAEQSAIQGIISADTWIGASDIEAEGMWKWLTDGSQFWTGDVSGEPVGDAYTRWNSIEPTGGAQDCARIGWSNDPTGWYWADSPCDYHYHTLCEGPKEF